MYNFSVKTLIEQGRVTEIDINAITDWIREVDLPKVPAELVALFLISCDNDIDKTQNTIKAYFRIKKKAPAIFDNRDIDTSDDLKKGLEVMCCASLPKRTPDNSAIYFFKLTDTDYSHADFVVNLKLTYMLADIPMNENPPDGLIILIDMTGIGFMHLTLFRPTPLKWFLSFLQEGFPMKLKAIYVLNSSYLVGKIIALIKVFLKTGVLEMIKPFPPDMDMSEFHRNYISADCLPKEYGGLLPSCDELHQMTVERLRELKPFFEAEEAMRKTYTTND